MASSSSSDEQFQSPKRIFCGVDMDLKDPSFVAACEDDVILRSANGLLDSNRLKSAELGLFPTQCLLGLNFSHLKLQYELRNYPFLVTEDLDGFPLVHVENATSAIAGNPAQILTQSLLELKNENVSDCCIGIPVHFTYQQRKELLAAASMARLVPHRLLQETTAAALAYRFSETDLPQAGELLNIAFVDVGYTSMQVSVVELKRDQLKVLSHAHDESIGERAFLQVIIDHVSAKFKLDANQMTLITLTKLALSGEQSFLPHLYESCVNMVYELSKKTEAHTRLEYSRWISSQSMLMILKTRQKSAHTRYLDKSLIEVKVKVELDVHGLAHIKSAEEDGSTIRFLEYPCDERQTTLRDKVEKAEKELADVSKQLKSALSCETERRVELEKNLEEEIRERQRLQCLVGRSSQKMGNFTEFSLAELQEVTDNFDNSCKIGEGGFASVYKAFLRYTNVAIKMLKAESSQGDIEFDQEMEILTKVRHPNLVSLIGANAESRALIFEFVPNGSLDTFLTKGKKSRGELSWQDRIRIASEICSALIFLHSVPPHGIAHGDLKPQNILLDSNLISKLADFGISRKLYKTDDTFTPLHQTKIAKFTPAYCAPEFFSSSELTPRCDVYSFGIILLQLVTGRDAQAIKYFVEEALKRGNFNNEVDDSAGNWPIQEAEKLASLGLWCSHPLAYERPDLAKDVWPSIESMKHVAGLH